jgi:hypothetical protein
MLGRLGSFTEDFINLSLRSFLRVGGLKSGGASKTFLDLFKGEIP